MKESVIATILFADLVNSTDMSKNLTLHEYDDMIIDFQGTMYEIVSHHLNHFGYAGNGDDSQLSIAGDEMRLFLYSGSTTYDVRNALLIALKIKLGWLASGFNDQILKEGRIVSRIGVGINCGKVIKDVREWRVRMGEIQPTIEGYAINLTKRIESTSRDGSAYQIMVGDSFYRKCQESSSLNVSFGPPQGLEFKGLGQKIPVYEIVSFVNFEILSSMPDSFQDGLLEKMQYAVTQPMAEPWIFITLLRHYVSLISSGQHDYLEAHAIELAKQALEVVDCKPVIYNMLGWFHIHGKTIRNLDMALQYFEQSLGLEPRNEPALAHKARILDSKGKLDLARQAYEEILLHNPTHPEARKKVEQYSAQSG
ncbi:MAG: tetratricopeptide repeat protein [Deltaproteobacteria bacterium]|nr:tetratricopeptide repeat protein [Deltaproteobacteria bacterium]